jgi:hypothetical protein
MGAGKPAADEGLARAVARLHLTIGVNISGNLSKPDRSIYPSVLSQTGLQQLVLNWRSPKCLDGAYDVCGSAPPAAQRGLIQIGDFGIGYSS